MEPEATPQRRLRIRRKAPTVKYGYNGMFEGTPKQAEAFAKATGRNLRNPAQFYRSSPRDPEPAPAVRRPGKPRTISLPRTRSREQSHSARRTARSTPKTASRSGDSGDSSPPGSSPAALAALIWLLWGLDS